MPKVKSMNYRKGVLIIDEDDEQSNFIKSYLKSYGYDVFIVNNSDALVSYKIRVDVIFLSLMKFERDKRNILKNIVENIPLVPIVVQTRQDDMKSIRYFLHDRIVKFFFNIVSKDYICDSIISVLEKNLVSAMQAVEDCTLNSLVAVSPAMTHVLDLAWKAVDCATPLMIEGEFGVGKKKLANSIHASGRRSLSPFVIVNCRFFDQDKIEHILFGNVDLKTKNSTQYLGKFIEANGGTIVLEEPDALPLRVQSRIYHFIKTGKLRLYDSEASRKIDVRLIFLTEKNLLQEKNVFRKDLYYKISVFLIKIPSLRDRPMDIPWLAHFFLKSFCVANSLNNINISDEALALLTDYHWSDNAQELKNTILRSVIGLKKSYITADDFMFLLPGKKAQISSKKLDTCYTISENSDLLSDKSIAALDQDGEVRRLSDIEKEVIGLAIKLYREQMSEVARRLGIGRSTLYRKIREYNIEV
ncbi:sigma-54-dependent Fis family transcriptional regulator [Candidatus Liberibacter africanus]|uniref:sigma-54-dependent transcriptional regulator n=1 Tax=Liberibacter africanus TaxID=34020 RepID=UPI001AE996BC|nr:sigma 54-interacting transcriptional regulator [Candidatus Liberibacter africanus]QTP64177.1 sigma-54-dependent Fis family transcriptional regulator [Candidatus Liberibacter africanus]